MTLKAEGFFVRKNYSRRILKVLQGCIKKGENDDFPPFHRMFRLYSYYIKSPARCSSVLSGAFPEGWSRATISRKLSEERVCVS